MFELSALDWNEMLSPSKPIPEILLRGTITYLALFALLRIFRRQSGSLGPADLLVLLLIADASQNAMAGEYRSITDGLILVMTIMGWEYVLDYMAFRFPRLAAVIERPALKIIERGEVIQTNLDKELMTMEELFSHLRQHGVDDLSRVKKCFIEGDGHISVILQTGGVPDRAPDRNKA